MRPTIAGIAILFLALVPLFAAAGECTVYDPIAAENVDKKWNKKVPLVKNKTGTFVLTQDFGGLEYTFSVSPGIETSTTLQDQVNVTSAHGDTTRTREFKIKLESRSDYYLGGYLVTKAADCTSQTHIPKEAVAKVYVSERCYGCHFNFDHP